VELIREAARTGRPDAGWIFVSSLDAAYRIAG
jgi:nitrogen regulatory protein PII